MQVVGAQSMRLMPQVVPPRRFGLPMVRQRPKPETEKQHSPAPQDESGRPGRQKAGRPPSGNVGKPPSKGGVPASEPVAQVPVLVLHEPERQAMHAAPGLPWPHCCADCDAGGTHAPEVKSQHPEGHVCAVHADGVRHAPDWHVCADWLQSAQSCPRAPHWVLEVPCAHAPVMRSMQPLHGVQVPPTQVLMPGQVVHIEPLAPQRLLEGA